MTDTLDDMTIGDVKERKHRKTAPHQVADMKMKAKKAKKGKRFSRRPVQ